MNFRFRLTLGFLVISAAIVAFATVAASWSVKSAEQAALISDITEESSENADLIAGAVNVYAVDGSLTAAAADPSIAIGFESLVTSALMRNSNIVRLSLYDTGGEMLWSSVADSANGLVPDEKAFKRAISGETATGFHENVAFATATGGLSNGDLVTTYIPLAVGSEGTPSQVLEVAREVTGVLDDRVENARSSMYRTLFSTLGASFALLLGVVVSADTMLHRSRRKTIEKDRILAESQVAAERLELRNQQLQQINRERDKFLSMVSHELRTPLTTMLAFTETLRKKQDGPDKEANIERLIRMRRNGVHLNTLIEELLQVTQIHGESFEIVREKARLDVLVEDVRRSASALTEARNQTLLLTGDCEGSELFVDRRRFAQLMMNLLSNASLYSPRETSITIDVQCQGELVKLSVQDEGPGIPEEEIGRLFEQFFRCDNELTRSQSGLGLGLPIAKAIVDAHGGKISITSKIGQGTTATVLLPRA